MYDLVSPPPRFNEEIIPGIVKVNYGIKVESKNLVSDIGQNFLLTTGDGSQHILKIANPSETFDFLDAQNKALSFLKEQHYKYQIPDLITADSGKNIIQISDESNRIYQARLFKYLSGEFLADARPFSPALLTQVGQILGEMDQILTQFVHPAIHRHWHWDLKNALKTRRFTRYISDAKKVRLVEYFLLQFETEVVPLIPQLRESMMHNDANDYNIIVNKSADSKDWQVSGIIDFGDMVYSCTIFELAVALAYIMFESDPPLDNVAPVIKAYNKVLLIKDIELKVLFYCICARLCMSVTIAAYQRKLQPDNDYVSISEQSAWVLLEQLLATNPVKAHRIFQEACEREINDGITLRSRTIVEERKKRLGKSLSISYKKPLKIIKGAMQYLYDQDGNTYLDCVNNVCHVGHCHPTVVRAAQKQMAILNTNTRYLHDYLIQYAKRITDTLPDPLNVCFFVNSGSEANELALRLAYTYTGVKNLIIVDNAYHGNTSALIDISPYKYEGKGGAGPGFYTHKVIMPDTYRGPYKADDPLAAKKYAKHVAQAVNELKRRDKRLAGFMSESLLGCGGQIVLPDGYLEEVYSIIRASGGVCIADEVQVGFGRVGSMYWGFELQGVVPDIVTMGKPIGNGHPLAAVVTTPQIADSFNNGMEYFNTFGGNPVSCAVGMAVLDVIGQENLQENALSVGNHLLTGFHKLKNTHELIGDVRGSGLFIGIELVQDRKSLEPATHQTSVIINKMREEGILLSTDGPFDNVLKIKPPLVFTKDNAEYLLSSISHVMERI